MDTGALPPWNVVLADALETGSYPYVLLCQMDTGALPPWNGVLTDPLETGSYPIRVTVPNGHWGSASLEWSPD